MEDGIHYNGPHQAHRTTGQPARRTPAQAGVLHPFGYPPLKACLCTRPPSLALNH
jgi:hypothetical protein